jgi:O-antigen/teichoic acid export membrane protein
VLAFCLFCSAVGTIGQGASSLLVSADRQHTILIMTIVLGILKFGLDMTLISRFGLHGAIVAIVVEALIGSVSYVMLGMRVSGMRLAWGRLLRIVFAAALAAAAASLAFTLHLVPLLTLLIGGVVLCGLYLPLTLLLGCWSRADISQMQGLHQRFASGQPLLLGRLLSWCSTRAERFS